jgi:hypothetical protein
MTDKKRFPPPSSDPTLRHDVSVLNELEHGDEVTIGRAVYYVTEMCLTEHGTRRISFTPRDMAD